MSRATVPRFDLSNEADGALRAGSVAIGAEADGALGAGLVAVGTKAGTGSRRGREQDERNRARRIQTMVFRID